MEWSLVGDACLVSTSQPMQTREGERSAGRAVKLPGAALLLLFSRLN